ncbi:MAG: hypothetical protein OEN56_08580 [Gemmatimonadota bacterium]|nr:hypothetical protein [Gemmatimonadota bacterium]
MTHPSGSESLSLSVNGSSAAGTPEEQYRSATAAHGRTVDALERTISKLETGRLVSFVVGAVLGLLRNDLGIPPAIPTLLAAALLTFFLVLVVRHRRLRVRHRRAHAAHTLARAGLMRLSRDWSGLHVALDEFGYRDPLLDRAAGAVEGHPYVMDLDVFGPASVRALMGPTPSVTGSETLGRWLSAPAPIDVVQQRQAAVGALAVDPGGREELTIEALLVDRVGTSEWRAFLSWLHRPALFAPPSTDGAGPRTLPTWAAPFARVASPVTAGLFLAWAFSIAPLWSWGAPLAIQAVLAWRWGGALTEYFEPGSAKSPGLRRHHPLFAAWESYGAEEPAVRALQARLTGESGLRASTEIRLLERLLDWADGRASMIHAAGGAALLWDVPLAAALERWRDRVRDHVLDWFEALGELEALSALGTLAHDHPEWCFPELRTGTAGLEAEGLGHPLLSDDERRTSDVRLDPPGRFLLVTGSNMSGKSTLLRSLGLAAVMGQAGSVICATRAEMSSLRTFTSMRIHDSLTGGVSLFMAELLRLKALVDAADEGGDQSALLYLIDEVLQGTNSEERRVAARRIVRHLLASNAIGAVTTHDLALHEDPTLDPASTKVHFRETVSEEGEEVLTFDYKLRPGLATSRNALKLLRIVGLDTGDGE